MLHIGMSFRALADLERAFISYLNHEYGKMLEFDKIQSANFAFEYGMREPDYHEAMDFFLEEHLPCVRPIAGAKEAVASLHDHGSKLCIISSIGKLHDSKLKSWLSENFSGWQPRIFYANSMSGTNRERPWLEKQDYCGTEELEIFVTENPIDAQRCAKLVLEMEVIMLEQPWNIGDHPWMTHELGSWDEVLVEILTFLKP